MNANRKKLLDRINKRNRESLVKNMDAVYDKAMARFRASKLYLFTQLIAVCASGAIFSAMIVWTYTPFEFIVGWLGLGAMSRIYYVAGKSFHACRLQASRYKETYENLLGLLRQLDKQESAK